MRSLFWKGMLVFLVIILVAVGMVALLVGRTTVTEFRLYASVQGGMWDRHVSDLADYYADHGSWEGIQDVINQMFPGVSGERGRGRGGEGRGSQGGDFQLADVQGQVVGDTGGSPGGSVASAELARGVPIEAEGQVVGYLLPSSQSTMALPLDSSQTEFLERVERVLWVAALVALVVALVLGGLLFRSIIAPLRRLTVASQAISQGDLSARASVRGQDEVAQLARSFNQMAESLDRAEEARRNQTADVAHELRTPLTVLRGTLEAMVDGVYPSDRENLQAALTQVQTLGRLVEDLRLLALFDAGQLDLNKTAVDLAAFLREMVEAHRSQAQEREIDLALEMPPALPLVRADRDRLAQVVGNLLGNAFRYVPSGEHIVVRVTDQGREVTIAVADSGPGVPEDDLPRLFERFWRGDPTRQRATGGSGLGLTIARTIVEAHGGRIWAEPTPGGGLTVSFSLRTAQLA